MQRCQGAKFGLLQDAEASSSLRFDMLLVLELGQVAHESDASSQVCVEIDRKATSTILDMILNHRLG